MGIQDHLTCLLRNLYAGQESTEKKTKNTVLLLEDYPSDIYFQINLPLNFKKCDEMWVSLYYDGSVIK